MDDNFASIVGAIEEGRVLFDNLKKTIAYTLAHLWPELIPVFLNLAFSFPLAMNGLMILTIDLLTEQGPAISLAYEGKEADVMSRKPRNLKTERLVSVPSLFYSYIMAGLANAGVCMYAYFYVYIKNGIPVKQLAYSLDYGYFAYPDAKAGFFLAPVLTNVTLASGAIVAKNVTTCFTGPDMGTVVPPLLAASSGKALDCFKQWDIFCESQSAWYLTLILCQFWHIWNCRTRSTSIFTHGLFTNVVTIYGAVAAVAIMCAVIYIPVFHSINAFQTRNLGGMFWLPQFIYMGYIFGYNEFVKYFVRNRPGGWVAENLGW
jgi:sodium/potassium-transporting ATPase subunit alpha